MILSNDEKYQSELEEFIDTMYTVREYQFDPLGLHSDIRNIESIYINSGG